MGSLNKDVVLQAPPSRLRTAAGLSGDALTKLMSVMKRFEISLFKAGDLKSLEDYEMVMIADDSESLLGPATPQSQQQPLPTRWQELRESASAIVDIANCFDATGVDMFFPNRQEILSVKGSSDARFIKAFEAPPSGRTPLAETLEKATMKCSGEKPVLLFILTDGEPDDGPEAFAQQMRHLISEGRPRGALRVQIMACTGETDKIAWLNQLDVEFEEIDVTDDYHSEKQEVLNASRMSSFSRGDWCMKAMLGPLKASIDRWDEGCAAGDSNLEALDPQNVTLLKEVSALSPKDRWDECGNEELENSKIEQDKFSGCGKRPHCECVIV